MSPDSFDEVARDLERYKERLKHTEIQLDDKKREFANTQEALYQKDKELKRTEQELYTLYRQFDVNQERLKRVQEQLAEKDNKVTKKSAATRLQTFLATLLLLLASVLAGFGTNLLTSSNSNGVGIVLIVLAILTYIIGALMAALTIEGSNS